MLTLPDTIALGQVFSICMEAPEGSVAFILVSADTGPLNTKFGTLCVGFPFLAIWPVVMPTGGALCLDHLAECDPAIDGFTGYFQFAAFGPNPGQVGLSNGSSLTAEDTGKCIEPGDFNTYTQGGWGAVCQGGNPGCLRDAHFDDVYPGDLILGDPDGADGDGLYALVLTDSLAVQNFLPSGSQPDALDQDEVNPTDNTSAGVLAGQLTAAKLNVDFDDAGYFDSIKQQTLVKLGDLVFSDCVASALIGESVRDVIALADKAISGEISPLFDVDGDLVGDISFDDLNTALAKVNENFDN
ncbi:MAG TPA: hypothetical protein VFY71_03805, partial [Planctomycetota bacterium]|nr:hypothetical protein [Planctomycetota bacterium]